MKYSMDRMVAILFSFTCVLMAFSPSATTAGILFSADFENQALDDGGLYTGAVAHPHMAGIVSSPVRTGNYGVKFTLASDEAPGYLYGGYEPHVVSVEIEKYDVAHVGDTRWYAISINIDASWQDETSDPNGVVVTQWHQLNEPGESGKSPHLSIRIVPNGDGTYQWRVMNVWDDQAISTDSSIHAVNYDFGQVVPGQWVDFVVHAHWSYKSDGTLQVWKNGTLIVDVTGPNDYNDTTVNEMFKIGIYKSWWNVELPPTRNVLTAYHDHVRIGDANSSYTEVAATLNALNAPNNLRIVNIP